MCPHDEFTILYYCAWLEIIVRKCKNCGAIEIKIDGYANVTTVKRILAEIDGKTPTRPRVEPTGTATRL